MFQLMLSKILHKKWMIISLIIGNVLLIAIAASNPMYRDAALTGMLQTEFENYIESNNDNPAVLDIHSNYSRNDNDHSDYEKMEKLSTTITKDLGLTATQTLKHNYLTISIANSLLSRSDRTEDFKVKIGSLSNLTDHASLVTGSMYSDSLDSEGRIEAVVTMNGFVSMNLLVGEEYEFPNLKDSEGNPFHVIIVGVITNSDANDTYWVNSPDSYTSEFLISESLFNSLILEVPDRYNYDTHWYTLFDYTDIRYDNVRYLYNKTQAIMDEGNGYSSLNEPGYMDLLEDYLDKEQRISVTLTILMVPVLLLLCAFLYMLSRQLFDMEESEISLLKSRGASRRQIFSLYLMQSGFLTGIGLILGLPLAALITKAIGSASAFLEFVSRRSLQIGFTWELVFYTLGAVLVSVLMTIIPAIRQSKVSIVKQKQGRARAKKPFWEKFFLDFVLIAVSLYGFFNFYRTKGSLTEAVMAGDTLDPLLFLSSSLFILGCSLLFLRIIPLVARLIFALRKKKLSPAGYASFIEITRSGQKRYFIMTFLMITVALGIFNTTVARTIEANTKKNKSYLIGADLAIEENWDSNIWSVRMDPSIPLVYTEPDYGKYGSIAGVSSMTKVYVDDSASVGIGRNTTDVTVYGISTKEFGETTGEVMPSGLMEKHYYTYLNELAVNSDYVLASSNFRDLLGYEIGDSILYTTDDEQILATIVDFVDYFPGYSASETGLYPDGTSYTRDNFLLVGHLSTIQKVTGVIPYEVWMNFEDGNTDDFYRLVEEDNISLSKCEDLGDAMIENRRDPLYEGTNGILTMSFIVVLILCLAGYLIYWILSIRSRELQFGIFRAMGMSQKEIIHMLVNEQIFASILPVLAGTGIGIGASLLYVPIIQIAYASNDQVLPLELITQASDMVRLFAVILVMLIVGLVILIREIVKMKLNEALKLGED